MSDTSGLSPIERLPNEILIEGFYFLKKSYAIRRPSHFLNIALVSRRFHSLSLEFVYLNLRLNCDQSFLDKNDKAMFETFLKYSTSVRKAIVSADPNSGTKKLEWLGERLGVSESRNIVDQAQHGRVLSANPGPTSYGPVLKAAIAPFTNLKKLKLSILGTVTWPEFHQFLAQVVTTLGGLKSLEVLFNHGRFKNRSSDRFDPAIVSIPPPSSIIARIRRFSLICEPRRSYESPDKLMAPSDLRLGFLQFLDVLKSIETAFKETEELSLSWPDQESPYFPRDDEPARLIEALCLKKLTMLQYNTVSIFPVPFSDSSLANIDYIMLNGPYSSYEFGRFAETREALSAFPSLRTLELVVKRFSLNIYFLVDLIQQIVVFPEELTESCPLLETVLLNIEQRFRKALPAASNGDSEGYVFASKRHTIKIDVIWEVDEAGQRTVTMDTEPEYWKLVHRRIMGEEWEAQP